MTRKAQLRRAILARTKELLTRHGWTKGAAAKDRWGQHRNATSPLAAQFCLTGAIARAEWEMRTKDGVPAAAASEAKDLALELVTKKLPKGYSSPVAFNDAGPTTKEDVLKVVEKARAKA